MGEEMASTIEQVAGLLTEVGETHHRVYRIVEGADDDWASWYAPWPIDLSELADGREDLNVALRAGDVVHVPRAGSVYVGGSVERPGSFLLRGKTTAQQAIFAAGGVKDVADWSDVRLYRKTPAGKVEVTVYDLEAFEQGKPAPELQRNDVVVVGKHAGKAFFYGFLDFFKGALGVAKGI